MLLVLHRTETSKLNSGLSFRNEKCKMMPASKHFRYETKYLKEKEISGPQDKKMVVAYN